MDPMRWVPLLLLLAALGLIAVLFIPSLSELNNPMDKGPRQIPETIAEEVDDEKSNEEEKSLS
jgi:hypothetical protein